MICQPTPIGLSAGRSPGSSWGDRRPRALGASAGDGPHRTGSTEAPSPSSGPDDPHLIERLTEGDLTALEIVYDSHAPRLHALALEILGDERAAGQVVQEAFVRLWSSPTPPLTVTLPLGDRLLAMAREFSLGPAAEMGNAPGHVGRRSAESSASRGGRRHDDRENEIARAIKALPPEQRLAIELAYFDGLAERAIAERLGINIGRTRRLLRQAFAALRANLVNLAQPEDSPEADDPTSQASAESGGEASVN